MLILCLIIFIIIILAIWKSCVFRKKIKINHIFCFSSGYIFYCIIPILFFEIPSNDTTYSRLTVIYHTIPRERVLGYLIISFLFYLSFIIGSATANKIRFVTGYPKLFCDRYFNFNSIQKITFPLVFILGIFFLYIGRNSFFRGYTALEHTSASLSAYELLLNVFILIYMNSLTYKHLQYRYIRSFALNKWLLWFILYSFILLTTGGRLYVITSIISGLVFYSCIKTNGIKIKRFVVLICLIIFFAGIIGAVRHGVFTINASKIIVNIAGETLYTNWSNLTYLQHYSVLNMINWSGGRILFTGLINLFPGFLFPDKAMYMVSVRSLYSRIQAPLGALHFFPTYNGGFGIIPSMLFFLFLGRMLGRIYENIKSRGVAFRSIYCLITASLMFTLFRDPFHTSVLKIMLELSIIVPYAIVYVGRRIVNYVNS